jgi:hypothetical protein
MLPGVSGAVDRQLVFRLPESGDVRRREPAASQPVSKVDSATTAPADGAEN